MRRVSSNLCAGHGISSVIFSVGTKRQRFHPPGALGPCCATSTSSSSNPRPVMPEQLQPPAAPIGPGSSDRDNDTRGLLSRSPHPYHRLNSELFEASDRPTSRRGTTTQYSSATSTTPFPAFARDSPISESGTEADDEHFLKGLPAPKLRPHKGLRGRSEQASACSTPMLSPAVLEEEGRESHAGSLHGGYGRTRKGAAERARRRKELIRRATEVLLVVCQGAMVASNTRVLPFLRLYQRGKYLLLSRSIYIYI